MYLNIHIDIFGPSGGTIGIFVPPEGPKIYQDLCGIYKHVEATHILVRILSLLGGKKSLYGYTLDNIEWTFSLGNKVRVFDSDIILECHSGKTPIVDVFFRRGEKRIQMCKRCTQQSGRYQM